MVQYKSLATFQSGTFLDDDDDRGIGLHWQQGRHTAVEQAIMTTTNKTYSNVQSLYLYNKDPQLQPSNSIKYYAKPVCIN